MAEKKRKASIFDTINEDRGELENLEDKIIVSASLKGPSWNTETRCLQALSNVFITDREVIVTADLPNIKPETVKVTTIDEKLIEISAKMKKKVRFTDLNIYHREGEFYFLHCQDRVNVAFNTRKMKISYEGGIIEVRFPRK